MATLAASPRSTTITLASASAGPFVVGFRLFESDALTVYHNGKPRADFTVSATYVGGYDDNATISFAAPLAVDDVLVIDGDLTPRRDADYMNGDPGLTRKINIELPRLWGALAEVRRNAARSIKSFAGTVPFTPVANAAIIIDEDGNPVSGPTANQIQQANGDAIKAQTAAEMSRQSAEEAQAAVPYSVDSAAAFFSRAADNPFPMGVIAAKTGESWQIVAVGTSNALIHPKTGQGYLPNAVAAPYLASTAEIDPTGTSDSALPLNIAIDQARNRGLGDVRVPPGKYRLNDHVVAYGNAGIRGAGWQSAKFYLNSPNAYLRYTAGAVIHDVEVFGQGTAIVGVRESDMPVNKVSLQRIRIRDCVETGLSVGAYGADVNNSQFEEIQVLETKHSYLLGKSMNNLLISCNLDLLDAAEARGIKILNYADENFRCRNTTFIKGIWERPVAGAIVVEVDGGTNIVMIAPEINMGQAEGIRVNGGELSLQNPHFTSANPQLAINAIGGRVDVLGKVSAGGTGGRWDDLLVNGNVTFDGSQEIPCPNGNFAFGLDGWALAGSSGGDVYLTYDSALRQMVFGAAASVGAAFRAEYQGNTRYNATGGAARAGSIYEVEIFCSEVKGQVRLSQRAGASPFRHTLGTLAAGLNTFRRVMIGGEIPSLDLYPVVANSEAKIKWIKASIVR